MAEVSLEMLQTLMRRSFSEQAAMRHDVSEVRSLLLAVVDQGRRTERRVAELRDEIELMVKAELMGRLGQFETRIESRIDALEARLAPTVI